MRQLFIHSFFILMITWLCSFATERYALLAGNAKGGKNSIDLKYVSNDLQQMRSILKNYCGFEDRNITLLYNKNPETLKLSLQSLTDSIHASDTNALFLFYYSGHADMDNLLMADSPYALSMLKEQLQQIHCRIQISIFDACQSGSFTRLKSGVLAQPFLYTQPSQAQGRVVLYSSSEIEYSQESDAYGNSIFTFHLLNALKGCADETGDAKITLTEAYHYAYNHTIASTVHSAGGVQHPGYLFNIHGEGSIILSDLTDKTTGLLFDSDVTGTITVLQQNQIIVAQMQKKLNQQTRIAVGSGTYQIFSQKDKETYLTEALVQQKNMTPITQRMFQKTKKIPLYTKGISYPEFFHVSAGCHVLATDASAVHQQFQQYLASYLFYHMNPTLHIPRVAVTPTLGCSFDMKKVPNVDISFYITYLSFNKKNTYYGYISSPNEPEKHYGTVLSLQHDFSLFRLTPGIRYTADRGFLEGISLHFGMSLSALSHSIATTFVDSLFDLSLSYKAIDTGLLLSPDIFIDYNHLVMRTITAQIRLGICLPSFNKRLFYTARDVNKRLAMTYSFQQVYLSFLLNTSYKVW